VVTGIEPTTSGLLDQRRSRSDNHAPPVLVGVRIEINNINVKKTARYVKALKPDTPFAVRNEPERVLRYPSLRARLSTYLYANSGHLKIKLFPKRQKNFRKQRSGTIIATRLPSYC